MLCLAANLTKTPVVVPISKSNNCCLTGGPDPDRSDQPRLARDTQPSCVAPSQRTQRPEMHVDPKFLLYDIAMGAQETINGQPVTEEQIAAWADEAERGYDIAALKTRGRGRPGRGATPTQVVALRLTTEELAAIDARAAQEHKTRSETIRDALVAYAS